MVSLILASLMSVLVTSSDRTPVGAPAQDATEEWHPPLAAHQLEVTHIQLGSLSEQKTTFSPGEEVYISVNTLAGPPPVRATIRVRWTYRELDRPVTVQDHKQSFMLQGEGSTVFHIAHPDGWPAGRYRAEVFLDNQFTNQVDFTVVDA